MQPDRLDIELRPRTPWEAMDLGLAMARRHAGAIWRPWFALSIPVLVVVNAICWWLDTMVAAGLVMWWLKPLFDRVPLYVLSRAAFGVTPGTREVLSSRLVFAPGPLAAWLSIRRLHPSRALLLPVDMLEGLRGARAGLRGRLLQSTVQGESFALLTVCLAFETMVLVSLFVLGLMFIPTEYLSDSAFALWQAISQSPPAWVTAATNVAWWLAISATEPVYVAAGFALYLNRRTQLEAWDLELAFRRLAARARAGGLARAAVLLVALATLAPMAPVRAAVSVAAAPVAAVSPDRAAPVPLRAVLGADWRPVAPGLGRAIDRAAADPSLHPTREVTDWVLKHPPQPSPDASPSWWRPVVEVLAVVVPLVAEYGLWIALAFFVVLFLWRARHWFVLPAMARGRGRHAPPLEHVARQDVAALPGDVPAEARRLWLARQRREALSLLYRGGVERLAQALGTPLPPGATEAECLRRARALGDTTLPRAFLRLVRAWQAAAYARRLPDDAQFESLLDDWREPREAGA